MHDGLPAPAFSEAIWRLKWAKISEMVIGIGPSQLSILTLGRASCFSTQWLVHHLHHPLC